jgi:thymidylate kinase
MAALAAQTETHGGQSLELWSVVMDDIRRRSRPDFASFSGIDGSGKSTQIKALCTWLQEDGLQVLVFRFWDDIARLTKLRESTGHSLFKGDNGIGTPELPINRRDKNVKSSLMTGVRLILYFMDALSLRVAVGKALRSDADLVIFDRYIYDELANLPLHNPVIRAYIRLIKKLVPKPQILYFLDADPVMARKRKPEYPLEFLYINRQSFLDLGELIGGVTVIPPMPINDVKQLILRHTFENISFRSVERKDEAGKAISADTLKMTGPDGM